MRDRRETILRACCLALALLLAWQLLRAGFRIGSLVRVKIPAVPTLVSDAAAPPKDSAKVSITAKPSTNAPATTNSLKPGTNGTAPPVSNAVMVGIPPKPMGTNVSQKSTNSPAIALAPAKTNSPTAVPSRNQPSISPMMGKAMPKLGMGGGFIPGRGKPGGTLPAPIQARVDKIVNSELFGPVMHPMPMGLIGIAGEEAFLRTASGQTGMVKVGDSLGDLKLLRIGINRVLVLTGGETNELTVFNGYGSVSLLSEPKETPK